MENEEMLNNFSEKEAIPKYNGFFRNTSFFITTMLVLPFVAMGMTHAVLTTTIPDIRIRLATTAHELSFAIGFGTAGGIIGGLSACLGDRYSSYTDLIMAISLFLVGGSFVVFPYSASVLIYGGAHFILNFAWTLYQAVAHAVVTHVWGTEGGPVRFAIHLGYPAGSVIGPLIAMPFVSGIGEIVNCSNSSTGVCHFQNNSTSLYFNTTQYGYEIKDNSTIEYAYLIVAAVAILLGIIFTFMQLLIKHPKQKTKKMQSFRQVLSPSEWADGNGRFGVSILVFMIFFKVLQYVGMQGTHTYLVTYAVDSDLMSNEKAAALNSAVNGAGAVARAVAIIVAKYVAAPYMLFVEVHGQLLFGLLCLFYGTQSSLALWICAPALGAFREVIWPTGYAWVDYYIILLGVIVGLIDTGIMIVSVVYMPIQGYLYDNTAIESIFYMPIGFGIMQCLLTYVMSYFASRKGGRGARALQTAKKTESTRL